MLPNELIQKDYTFETILIGTIFNYKKIIKKLENGDYNIINIETKWSILKPFHVTIIAVIKVTNKINVKEIRENRMKNFLEGRR